MDPSIKKPLLDALDLEMVVSIDPDHPFLLDAPNALIGSNGSLVGLFIPSASEIKNPDQLLVRLALSRLAMPNYLRCVLILDNLKEKLESIYQISFSQNFHEVMRVSEIPSLRQFVRDRSAGNELIRRIPREIRDNHIRRFNAVWEEINVANDGIRRSTPNKNSESEEIYIHGSRILERLSWSRRTEIRLPKGVILSKESHLIAEPLIRSNSFRPKLRQLVTASTQFDYELDTGVPYSRPERLSKNLPVNLLFVNKVAGPKYDPLKPIRNAAFSGWITASYELKNATSEVINDTQNQVSQQDKEVNDEYPEQESSDD